MTAPTIGPIATSELIFRDTHFTGNQTNDVSAD